MTDHSLRDHLDLLVANEPAMTLTLDPVIAQGQRLRRRRHIARIATTATVVAVIAVAAVPLSLHQSTAPEQTLSVQPFALTGSSGAVRASIPASAGLTPAQQRMADAITQASPNGWTFDFSTDRWEGLSLEGVADDGAGPGRLMIGVSTGTQLLHPCEDSEFKAGRSCVERTLPDGSVLSVRGTIDYHGIEYDDVALTHPDGSGVFAESGNFTITWPLPNIVTPWEKKHPTHISRDAPTYTPEQLGQLALAVDRATR